MYVFRPSNDGTITKTWESGDSMESLESKYTNAITEGRTKDANVIKRQYQSIITKQYLPA